MYWLLLLLLLYTIFAPFTPMFCPHTSHILPYPLLPSYPFSSLHIFLKLSLHLFLYLSVSYLHLPSFNSSRVGVVFMVLLVSACGGLFRYYYHRWTSKGSLPPYLPAHISSHDSHFQVRPGVLGSQDWLYGRSG